MTLFPWEVNPLTIVAVFKGSHDILYIGADSQWTDSTGLKHYKNKLQFLTDKGSHIAWGTSGNPQIGITEFRDWITAHTWADSESAQISQTEWSSGSSTSDARSIRNPVTA